MQWMMKTVLTIFCLALLASCTAGRTAFDKAEKLEREGKLDEAFLKYAEVSMANPDKQAYRLRFLQSSDKAARVHLKKADDHMAVKEYDRALQEYQTASAIDPSLERAKQQIDSVRKLRDSIIYYKEGAELEKSRKLEDAFRAYKKSLEFNPDNSEAKDAVKRILQTRKTKIDGFELNLKSNKPITLKFRDTRIKDVFNILSRLSGINFIFDESVKDQNFSIFLENATFQQALEIMTNMNKLGRKVLNDSTILIYAKTPEKTKQYEELVVRTFILNNLDAKKAINLLRTMLQIKKIYVNEDLNAIVIRDVPETVEVAQRILEANDLTDAEVLLEVEVIELTKSNEDMFGLTLSQYAVSAIGSNSGGLISDSLSASNLNLQNITHWASFQGFMTIPNATYNFGKTISNAEVLANPKIRVKNREKSKFSVATREPITTISTTGTTGGFSTNVQYVDVGIKVNAEPTIQLNNEISLKLSLEVSSKLGESTATDGTTLITIGTRNLDTVLSLKDGETSIIGGLISTNESKRKNKFFIIGDIPIVGPLLTGNDNKKDKTELVLAITPRIVRLPSAPESNLSSFWSGKEDEPSTTSPYSSFIEEPGPTAEQPAPTQKPAGSPIPLETVQPSTPPAPVPAPAPVTQPALPQQGESQGTLTITAPPAVSAGSQFTVEVKTAGAANLYSTPFVLTFDPNVVEPVGVSEGNFMKQDGRQTVFRTTIDGKSGKIRVALNRVGNVGGVSGSGTLISALFRAKAKGLAGFGVQDPNFSDAEGNPVVLNSFNVAVEIR
jgi:general secretion pathway protein D